MEIKDNTIPKKEVYISAQISDKKDDDYNFINNNKEEKGIKIKTESNFIKENLEKYYNNFIISRKKNSFFKKIKIYKNKYSSPDINKLKHNDKNKLILNVVYQNNNSYREGYSLSETEKEYNSINDQFFTKKNYFTERVSRNNNNPYIYSSHNNLSLNNYNNIPYINQIIYTNTYDQSNIINAKINNKQNINNANNIKILRKSNSYSNYMDVDNYEIDKFEKMKNEGRYEIIKIRFPREQILNNNKIEFIPGKLEVINPDNGFLFKQLVEKNNNNEEKDSNKHIINQENIIINNGFVNMNNNYYVNNIENRKENEDSNKNDKDKLINNNYAMKENLFINKFNKENNYLHNNNEIKNKHLLNNEIKPLNNQQYNLNKIDYNNILYNNYNDNLFNQRLNEYNFINNNLNRNRNHNTNDNSIYNQLNINTRNNFNNILSEKNKIYLISNNNIYKVQNKNKLIGNSNQFNSLYIDDKIIPNLNPEIQNNNKCSINNNMNQKFITNIVYNNMKNNNLYSRNNSQFIPINRNINNDIYNHIYNLNNNPQLFHPKFHSNQIKYSSNLQIQCPVQMLVKKSKVNKLTRHKLITYYPQKVKIEIRPCFIFQSKYKIPLYQNNFNNLNDGLLYNQFLPKNYINNNEHINQRVVHNRIKRRRPVFKIPPCKKGSVSQGKSLNKMIKKLKLIISVIMKKIKLKKK